MPPDTAAMRRRDIWIASASVLVAMALGMLLAAIATWPRSASPLLWGLACLASGVLVGFLFAVPRALQRDAPADAGSANSAAGLQVLRVNTNLEQISDWVTKILVGIGLVNLQQVPSSLESLGKYLAAQGASGHSSPAFAVALSLYFSVLGFLAGYLLTRLSLAAAFARADRDSAGWELTQARLASLTTDTRQLKRQVFSPTSGLLSLMVGRPARPVGAGEAKSAAAKKQGAAEFDAMLQAYREATADPAAFDEADAWRAAEAIAEKLGSLVVSLPISRADLANAQDEASLVALANAIHLQAEPEDLARLLACGAHVTLPHARVQWLAALGRCAEEYGVPAADRPRVDALLKQFAAGASEIVLEQIRRARAQLGAAPG